MSESRQTISRLFSALAEALDSMDDQGFDLLLRGKANLRLVDGLNVEEDPPENLSLGKTLADTAQKLKECESREAAMELLASINQPRRKEFLLLLAKECHVPATSKDSITLIERKLIENVVGAKLTAQAFKRVKF